MPLLTSWTVENAELALRGYEARIIPVGENEKTNFYILEVINKKTGKTKMPAFSHLPRLIEEIGKLENGEINY